MLEGAVEGCHVFGLMPIRRFLGPGVGTNVTKFYLIEIVRNES